MNVIRNDPVPYKLPDREFPPKVPERADEFRPPGLDVPAPPPGTFVEMMRSLSDPYQSMVYAQRSIELHAQVRLKGAFEREDGAKVGFDLRIKIDVKVEQAFAAYAKTADPQELGDHFSPEKTAKRIVDFARSFLGAFQANHGGEDGTDVLKGFFDLARKAIERGFGEAEAALGDGFGEPAEKTRAIVGELLDAAERSALESAAPAEHGA